MVIHRGQQKVLWIYYDGYGSGFVMVSSCIHAMHRNAKKRKKERARELGSMSY